MRNTIKIISTGIIIGALSMAGAQLLSSPLSVRASDCGVVNVSGSYDKGSITVGESVILTVSFSGTSYGGGTWDLTTNGSITPNSSEYLPGFGPGNNYSKTLTGVSPGTGTVTAKWTVQPGCHTGFAPGDPIGSSNFNITVTAPPNQPPNIDSFSAVPTSGPPALSVSFSVSATDPDGDPITYFWDFDDGNTSTDQNPTHLYTVAGVYNATVTVSDDQGNDRQQGVIITVNNPPTIDMIDGSPPSGPEPHFVTFSSTASDLDGDPLTYSWDFGDGTPLGSGANPTHTYASAGSYTATLTVDDGQDTDVGTVGITVTTPMYVAGPQTWESDTQNAGAGNTYQPDTFVASWVLDGSDNIEPVFEVWGDNDVNFTTKVIYPITGLTSGVAKAITTAPYRYWKVQATLDTGPIDNTDTPRITDITLNETPGAAGALVLQKPPNEASTWQRNVGVGTTNPLTALDIDGAIKIADEGVKPACNAIRRGLIWHDFGGGGVKDDVQICLKGAGGAGDYAWRTIY